MLVPSAVDPDLWGHLFFGSIYLGGTLPTTNQFAYTALTHPWLNHELLAETTMAAVYAAGGAVGLVAMKLGLGLAALAFVHAAAARRSRTPWAAAVATSLAAVIMLPGFMIRPQLFTFAFLALFLHVLAASRYRARGAAWALPAVAVVWANTHGGVLAGIGLAAIALTAETLRAATTARTAASRIAPRHDPCRIGARAAALIALLAAATLVNPYGAHLPLFLLSKVTPRVPITEWAAVTLADGSFPLFKVTLVALAVWIAFARRVRLPEIAVVVATAVAALLHRRHVPLFAIAAAPLVAAALADGARRLRTLPDLRRATRFARPALAAVVAMQVVLATVASVRGRGRIEVDPGRYPVQALRFLAENGIAGRVALPFDWGEFALWSLPPGSSVAVDGRFTTAYPQQVLDEAWRFMTGGSSWDDLLTRHPTDIVVSDRRHAPARLLRGSDEWEYVYSDPVAVVFVRRTASQAATLARFTAGSLRYDGGPLATDFPALARGAAGPRLDAVSATVTGPWTDS